MIVSQFQVMEKIAGPVCGVFAASIISGKEFSHVFSFTKEALGRTDGWQGRMKMSELKKVLSLLDVKWSELPMSSRQTLKKHISNLEYGTTYLVFITSHFITVRNGLYYDQSTPNGAPIELNKHISSKLVKGIFQIEE